MVALVATGLLSRFEALVPCSAALIHSCFVHCMAESTLRAAVIHASSTSHVLDTFSYRIVRSLLQRALGPDNHARMVHAVQVAEQLLTAVSWLKRELLGVTDGYELPEPQLPATAGAASQAEVDAAVKKAEKKAAAEQAEAEADAASN